MIDALRQVRPVTHRGQLSNIQLKKNFKIQLANQNIPRASIQNTVNENIKTNTAQKTGINSQFMNSNVFGSNLQSISSISRGSTPNTFHRRHKSSSLISGLNQNLLNGRLQTKGDPADQIKLYQQYMREYQQSQKVLQEDISKTLKLYEIDDLKSVEEEIKERDQKRVEEYQLQQQQQKDKIFDFGNFKEQLEEQGKMTQRLPIQKQLDQSMNARQKSFSRLSKAGQIKELNQTAIDTKSKVKQFMINTSLNNSIRESQQSSDIQFQKKQPRRKIDSYDFDLKLQKIEKTYHEFEEYFKEYRDEKQQEQIKDVYNPNNLDQVLDSQVISHNYAQCIQESLVQDQWVHDKIEEKFYKLKGIKKELNELRKSLSHINYNRVINDQKLIFQDLPNCKCQCKNNKFLQRATFVKEDRDFYNNKKINQNQQVNETHIQQPNLQTRPGTTASSYHQKKKSFGRLSQAFLNNNTSNPNIKEQIKIQLQSANLNKDLRISIEGYVPATLSLNSLLLEQTQMFFLQPIDEFLRQKPAVDLNNMFMKEIEKQNKDIKIFEQIQNSFYKDASILTNTNFQDKTNKQILTSDEQQDSTSNGFMHQNQGINWKMNPNHLDRTQQRLFDKSTDGINLLQSEQSSTSKMILENEVMRSLFDLEMCVSCKYQKILYRDFIYQIHRLDMDSQNENQLLNDFIKQTIDGYLDKNIQLNDNKQIQRIINRTLELQQAQLKQVGKLLPLHSFMNEKVLKFFSFIISMMFQFYSESFLDQQKLTQNLQSELSDLKYTRSDNELLQMELMTLRQQLSEANELLSIYNQDRQVVIKDIEKDIQELNFNFNSHSRHQQKLKDNIEKEVKSAINEIQDQNKTQNDNLGDMMNIILKKFEIIKYSLNKSQSVGTQTIIMGQQRLNSHETSVGLNQGGGIQCRMQYWRNIDLLRPMLQYEISRRRFYEVFEIQQICEEFIQFITKIKLKNLENMHLPLSKLPYTIILETKQEKQKLNSNKKAGNNTSRPHSSIQMTYTLDKKVSPLMRDIIKYGSKDELLNLMSEYLLFKNSQNKKGDLTTIDINHLFQSLERVCSNKNHLGSKLMLLIFNYESEISDMEELHSASIANKNKNSSKTFIKKKSAISQMGKLSGELVNINEAVNEKVTQLTYHTYYLLDKIFKKEKYITTLFKNLIDPQTLSLHQTDLLTRRLSLRIVFILFERMLGKMQLFMKQDLLDSVFLHYAQGDDYREASQLSKYFSLIAVQIMQKNKVNSMNYEWLVEQIYGLITTQTSVSIQDLINDDFTSENIFNMVQQQFEKSKEESLNDESIALNLQVIQVEDQKSPDFTNLQSPSEAGGIAKMEDSQSTIVLSNNKRTYQAKTALIQLASSFKRSQIPKNKASENTVSDLTPSPNVLRSKFDANNQYDEEDLAFQELNHITDPSIKVRLDAKKDFLVQKLNVEKFIRLLNYQKIYLPCIKDALIDYKTYFTQIDDISKQEVKIEKPANQVKTEQQYLSFMHIMKQEKISANLENFFTVIRRYLINERSILIGLLDFVSLFVLLAMKHLEQKKSIVYEKYKSLDTNGKGLKEQDLQQLLMQLDFHRQLKQKQFQHIVDDVKLKKINQLLNKGLKSNKPSANAIKQVSSDNLASQQQKMPRQSTIVTPIHNQLQFPPASTKILQKKGESSPDKLEEFQRLLEEKKSDSFISYKYKEIQEVIENKWWVIKELNFIRDDFLGIAKDIEKKKMLNTIKQKTISNMKDKSGQKLTNIIQEGIELKSGYNGRLTIRESPMFRPSLIQGNKSTKSQDDQLRWNKSVTDQNKRGTLE